jgi:hypothetical protein
MILVFVNDEYLKKEIAHKSKAISCSITEELMINFMNTIEFFDSLDPLFESRKDNVDYSKYN